MPGDRWGADGPPEEAYGRVTHPERFAPLHDEALRIVADVRARFDVLVDESATLRTPIQAYWARPTVRLTPRAHDAAPLTIAFTSFPGLIVEAGRWFETPIPVCGCDACDEQLETGLHELRELVAVVTGGGMREEVMSGIGGTTIYTTFSVPGDPARTWTSGTTPRDALDLGAPRRIAWAAWPLAQGGG